MGVLKYSRQREYISDCLAATDKHPTAADMYIKVREQYPNISMGTVYRNLSLLVSMGKAKRLTDLNGTDHFDAVTCPHAHFVCTECQSISDYSSGIERALGEYFKRCPDGEITDYSVYLYGKCPACAKQG